ncbi:MAG: cyclophilin-like fold protein [Candidatus Eisenbacteria bacterium]
MKPIVITIGEKAFEAELNDSATARLVGEALPFEARGLTWGDEIYFRIPVAAEPEDPKAIVAVGDIGYWPPGSAFCIFYGKTPASGNDDIIPASPVNVIGRITSDVSILKGIRDPGTVRVEAHE